MTSKPEMAETNHAEVEFEPLAVRMLAEAEVVFAPLANGRRRLRAIRAAAGSVDELRQAIAEAYRGQLDETVRDPGLLRNLESFARSSRCGAPAHEAVSVVNAGFIAASEDIDAFEAAVGNFAGDGPSRATPAHDGFIAWLQFRIRAAWSTMQRDEIRQRKIGERLGAVIKEQTRVEVASGSGDPPIGGRGAGEPSVPKPTTVIDDRRMLFQQGRRAVARADVDSPDIKARTRDKREAQRIVRGTALELLNALESEDGCQGVTDASAAPALVASQCVRRAAERVLGGTSRARIDKRVGRHRADALYAGAVALRLAAAATPPSDQMSDAQATARWHIGELALALDLALVVPVTALLADRIVDDLGESRFEADLEWLGSLLDFLGDEVSPSQLAGEARVALELLSEPRKKHPSAIDQARAAIDAATPKADHASDLLAVWDRMRAIVGDQS